MRGEVWTFGGRDGADAWLVVQHDALAAAPTVVALAVTRRAQRAGAPVVVDLPAGTAGLDAPAWVKVTQVHTLPVGDARARLGVVPDDQMERVDRALSLVLGLSLAGSV